MNRLQSCLQLVSAGSPAKSRATLLRGHYLTGDEYEHSPEASPNAAPDQHTQDVFPGKHLPKGRPRQPLALARAPTPERSAPVQRPIPGRVAPAALHYG